MEFNKIVRLKDIAEVEMGQSPKSEFYNEQEGTPFLQGTRTFGLLYPIIDTYTTKVTKWAIEGDILFSVRAPVGDINIATIPLCIGRGLAAVRSKTNNQKFLFYLLKAFNNYEGHSTGTIFSSINKSTLENLEFAIPEENIQSSIGDFLWSIDEKIELNNNIISNLEQLSQTLFKHWFIDFEFPNEEGKPYKSSGGEMVESELGRIPKMFNLSTFGEEITITRGASPRPIHDYLREEGRPWIKISDVNGLIGYYLNSTKQFIKEEGIDKSRTIEPGTLILSNSATPGIPVFVNITASVHDGWLIFKDYKKLSKEFYFLYLKTNRDKILSLSNGSVFRNLKTDILKKYQIVIPSDELFDKFQNIVMPLFNMIKNTTDEVNTLQRLRDTLLPKLLSGEIESPDNLEV